MDINAYKFELQELKNISYFRDNSTILFRVLIDINACDLDVELRNKTNAEVSF